MASNWQPLVVPFVSGLDLKTDSKLVTPPSLIKCQNAVFTKHGTLKRRPGFSAVLPLDSIGADIVGGRGLTVHGDELLLQNATALYSYDALRANFLKRGNLQHLDISQKPLASTNSAQSFADVCTLSDVTVTCWEDSRGGVYASAYNTSTGAAYVTELLIDVNGQAPVVVSYGGTMQVFWYSTGSFDIKMIQVVPNNVAATLASVPVTVRSDVNIYSGVFDVVGQGNYGYLVYLTDATFSTHTVRLAKLNSAGDTFNVVAVSLEDSTVSMGISATDTYVNIVHAWGVTPTVTVTVSSFDAVLTAVAGPVEVGLQDFTRVTCASVGTTLYFFAQSLETAIGSYVPNSVISGSWDVISLAASATLTERHSCLLYTSDAADE